MIAARTSRRPEWRDAVIEGIWNFEDPLPEELVPNDTVGAVARDREGRLAAANSTGGAVPMLLGRVGDSPIPGAGFWASPHGAVVTTGIGEEIIRRLAAKAVADRMAAGEDAVTALFAVVRGFPEEASFGAVAVGPDSHGVFANREMATAVAGT
jgi:L-asparaginase/beta-aspartyl-peptidase (threonine type)